MLVRSAIILATWAACSAGGAWAFHLLLLRPFAPFFSRTSIEAFMPGNALKSPSETTIHIFLFFSTEVV